MAHIPGDQIFTVNAVNTKELFKDFYFLIPPYQRPYSWGKDNVSRLFEDLFGVLNNYMTSKTDDDSDGAAVNDEKNVAFLGTIITVGVDKANYKDYFKHPDKQRTENFLCVIDGQQRLTTFTLISSVICRRADYLSNCLEHIYSFDADYNSPKKNLIDIIRSQLNTIINDVLGQVITEEKRNTSREFYYVPRLIRSPFDYFKDDVQYQFESGIACYIKDFTIDFLEQNTKLFLDKGNKIPKYSPFKLDENSLSGANKETYKRIDQILNFIEGTFSYFCVPPSDDENLSKFDLSAQHSSAARVYQETDVGAHTFDEIKALCLAKFVDNFDLTDKEIDELEQDEYLKACVEFILFCGVFLERVYFISVKSSTEDCAFSMFDSLNTTGEPLTAYETFKAQMINRQEDYQNSRTQHYFNAIDAMLDPLKDKGKITADLLIQFAKACTGKKLNKQLNDQRNYLRSLSLLKPELSSGTYEEALIEQLYITTDFYFKLWGKSDDEAALKALKVHCIASDAQADAQLPNDVILCLSMLSKAKHTVVVPVLTRFYALMFDQLKNGNVSGYEHCFDNFCTAVRVATAFSTLYRLITNGTEGIDDRYTALFKDMRYDKNENPFNSSLVWLRQSKVIAEFDGDKLLNFLKDHLRYELNNKIIESSSLTLIQKEALSHDDAATIRQEWLKKAESNDIFAANCKLFANFAIIITSLPDCEDIFSGNLTDDTLRSCLSLMSGTTERLAPLSSKSGLLNSSDDWPSTLYNGQNGNCLNTLGNLTVMNKNDPKLGELNYKTVKSACMLLSYYNKPEFPEIYSSPEIKGGNIPLPLGQDNQRLSQDLFKAKLYLAEHEPKLLAKIIKDTRNSQFLLKDLADSETWDEYTIAMRSEQIAAKTWKLLYRQLMPKSSL